jgi:hypothetical protein
MVFTSKPLAAAALLLAAIPSTEAISTSGIVSEYLLTNPGDTLVVEPGIATSNVGGNAIVQLSKGNGSTIECNKKGKATDECVIDAALRNRCIHLVNGGSVEFNLIGMTLRNGKSSFGGAMFVQNAIVNFDDLVIEDSKGDWGGGAHIDDSIVNFVSSTFRRNYASMGGGGVQIRNKNSVKGKATFKKCKFESNTAEWLAGGLYIHFSPTEMTACSFTNNAQIGTRVDYGGGAINVSGNTADVKSHGNFFSGNAVETVGRDIFMNTANVPFTMDGDCGDGVTADAGSALDIYLKAGTEVTGSLFSFQCPDETVTCVAGTYVSEGTW